MKFFLPFYLVCSLVCSTALAQNQYSYTIDLKNITKDMVEVKLQTPKITEETVVFSFPKAIPGSYARKDFGRFIKDFTAIDRSGNKLKTEKINDNQYRISNAGLLASLTYKVSDTWDEKHKDFIFQPGGSNIDAGKNVVINNHAFYGYFEGYNSLPIEIEITKPADFYGATNLKVEKQGPEKDFIKAKNYVYLADNPIIYAKPDTTSFYAGKTRINVAVYSATGKVNSQKIAGYLKPITNALQNFFTELPVKSYQFLYFFEDSDKGLTNRDKGEGGYGALEHNYSSLYYLPEIDYEKRLKSMVYDVSMHEFLHILTPLNLHSTEIANFNFTEPKMSQHLWLYEGVTEYFSELVQLQNSLITEKEYFDAVRKKINQAEEYGNFSMTEMSSHVMEDKFQKKYSSVYNRGAVIALMLDLSIREKTNDSKDLKSVIVSLTKKYGPDKPFDDQQFFSDFIASSHPEVESFINSYIVGSQPLDFETYFNKLGYEYATKKNINVYYPGKLGVRYEASNKTFVFTDVEKNTLKIRNDDVFLSANNEVVTSDNVENLIDKYFMNNTDHAEISVTVLREGKEQVLSGKLNTGYLIKSNYLAPKENATEAQIDKLKRFSGRL
jgi:predicted metalloprotease with PDZ domain